ncbi:MAG TPA: secretin N-terminal domain-containing protein [Verrucomicrobiae bacterium]|jgi:type II secretory pathway component GspD/PulD (secretin)
MKTFLLALLLAFAGSEILAQTPPGLPAPGAAGLPKRRLPPHFPAGSPGALGAPAAAPRTPTTAPATPTTAAAPKEEVIPAGMIDFQGVDASVVLDQYAKLVNRTVIRGALPTAQIILKTTTDLTKPELIEALQAVLAVNNISVINVGDKFLKAVQSDQAGGAGDIENDVEVTNLPVMGSYLTRVVQLHYVMPTKMAPVLAPFSKLPNSIFPIDDNGILVIRDYTENVKRMLEMIAKIDVNVPAEYTNEVIPIRYAKVDDIANALNSLGGGGGAVASIGTAPSSGRISGFSGGSSGINGMGGTSAGGYQSGGFGGTSGGINGGSSFGGNRTYGSTTANGTPSGTGSTFAQRLNNIINKASGSGQDQIQLFGQTKIIPNESSSSLLVFATRQDMEEIKSIIAKLDVPLAQVLVEAVIIDVTLGNTFDFGVSVAQNPTSLGGNTIGGGGYNNGQPFADFVKTVTSSSTTGGFQSSPVSTITSSLSTNGSSFANALPGGFNYFGNIGQTWNIALNAAESDSHASIIQRPRIQTSQAKPAQFFVGDTVPYVTSSYNGGGVYGSSSSYSQLSVGVELDVTPFINPDGAVSMDIQQEIDDLNGFTSIVGVGDVPNTIKRTLNTSITVRDRDTVMLGGFIKSDKSHSASGVPWLSSIPLLGNLFSSRTDSKDRQELIVLMRPTVLATPELAAKHTVTEEQRLPGVSRAASEDAAYERKLVDEQRIREQKKYNETKNYDGFFVPPPADTNGIPDKISVPSDTLMNPPDHNTNAAPPTGTAAAAKPLTPAQTKQLEALFSRYLNNEMTTAEYQAACKKVRDGN